MKTFQAFFIILLYTLSASGQTNSYKFRHYTVNDGLAENTVKTILEDSKGFIWFGSTGLSKFDGYKFTNYTKHTEDTTSLINNVVQALFEDSRGNIWVGTKDGICFYNRSKNNFTHLPFNKDKPQLNITSIVEDRDGILYFATNANGLLTYNPVTKEQKVFIHKKEDPSSISDNWVPKILVTKNNEVWIIAGYQINIFNKATQKFEKPFSRNSGRKNQPPFIAAEMLLDSKGYVWTCNSTCVSKFDPLTRKREDYPIRPHVIPGVIHFKINSFAFINDDIIWIGTENGIVALNIKTKLCERICHQQGNNESLSGDNVEYIYADKSNNIWIGTKANGAEILKSTAERFIHYVNTNPSYSSLSSNEIYGMAEDNEGCIWITTFNGLNKFSPKTKKFQSFFRKNTPGLNSDLIWTAYHNKKIRNDLVWLGTETGLAVMSSSSNKLVNPFINPYLLDSLGKTRIMAVSMDNHNNLLLGTKHGLIKINLGTEKITRYLIPRVDNRIKNRLAVWRIFPDSKNNLWVGTPDGLFCQEPGSEKLMRYKNVKNDPRSIRNNEITEIFEDKSGGLWVGTTDGLNKFDPVNKNFERINFPNISSTTISSIQQDDSGCLWIGTIRGLLKYDTKEGRVINYEIDDGIQSNDFNFPSLVSSTGEFYFGGINGFNVFKPNNISTNKHIPPVYLTGFYIMNKPVKTGENFNGRVIINDALENVQEITLDYDENIISIEFSTLNFQSPGKNLYTHIMENYETSWSQADKSRFITYTLEPGSYIFKVKGSNNDNVWNQTGFTLKISIVPPWWKTLWFRIIIFLFCFGLLYLVLRIRTRYLEKQKANLERLVWERTSELSKQQNIVKEQAEKIQNANLELEQLNSELEMRVIERTAELEKAKEKAEKADEIKSEFLAQMSHEIRSPINVVLSFSNLIRSEIEDKVDDDLKEGFKSISNAGKRIIRTVDLLLNMSEIQTQTYEFIPSQLDLIDDILHGILPEYQLTAKEKKLRLSLENKAQKRMIIGDNYTLEQIFANLIDNAVKYTNTGSIVIFVYNDPDESIICEIKDTGIGISQGFMDKIFHPFTQEEQGYTRKYEGNGLGLALVKKYCELNGIDISVKSKKGEGTTFILKFNRTINTTLNNEI